MSIDTAISKTTLRAVSERAVGKPNAAVIKTIEGHHAALAARLGVLTEALVVSVPDGPYLQARSDLDEWYRTQLLPHAVAEEQALYSKAAEIDATRLLICGMLGEHRMLVALIAALSAASGPTDVVCAAAAARAVFTSHVSKENDLLLPALDQAGVDLGGALQGMHEVLGHTAVTTCTD